MITSLYCTLADVKSELNAESTVDDQKIMRGIRQLSRRIDRMFRSNVAVFVPNILTRQIALDSVNINSWDRTLIVRVPGVGYAPLLSVTSVVVGNQTLVVGTNVQAYPTSVTPIGQLQLIGDRAASWYTYIACNTTAWGTQFATIGGVWGYNVDYANAWLEVDALDAGIDASVTTLTVDDVDGDNPYGEAPRISAGNLIQIDDEWMDVIATDTATNAVTVIRGVNGSTAAPHAMGAAVSVYLVDENIRRICRQAANNYAKIGAFDIVRITDFATIQFAPDLLQEIADLLNLFANG